MSDYRYIQCSGKLFRAETLLAVGYAGRYDGKNNPDMQDVKEIGPLPVGLYRIGDPYKHELLGPITMNLEPNYSNEMLGRADFRIHGDSSEHPGMASKGCIVMPREIRQFIADHLSEGSRSLEVVKEE